MQRKYRHIKDFEKELIEYIEQGYTLQENREKYGFTYNAIDMVIVYADSEIEIKWKFSCDFENTEENK